MKRLLYIASILILGAVACTKEMELVENSHPASEDNGMVAVTMRLAVPVELTASTRATEANKRAEAPKIESIRVAVFGTSGYPQAYALATPVNKTTQDGKTVYTDSNAAYASDNYQDPDDIYYFKVLLPVYDGEAHVHIIANGDKSIPFDSVADEHSIMGHMESTDDVGAYWAMVVLPDGILTQKDENGILQTDDEGNYIPSDETKALFEDLVLVRNFAEVSLKVAADANISDVSWALVNTPVSGSIAPVSATGYRPKAGSTQPVFFAEYVDDYKNYIFYKKTAKMVLTDGAPVYDPEKTDSLTNIKTVYNGYMASTALNTLPADDEIVWTDADQPLYIYERTDPKLTNPTYIMMRAKYGTESTYSYYRVDLMEEEVGGYYPIYRNYKYQIDIPYVGNHGASTPSEAANRNSGGNMSMSAETKTLTDVSDGKSRLFVEFVEKTYTTSGQKTFWAYYVPDVADGVVDNSSIVVTVKDMGDNPALANKTITSQEIGGRKFYTVTLNGQDDNVDLESVLQVKATNGKSGTDKSTLYRDVTLRVMKKMDMALSLNPPKVEEGKDLNTVLHIALKDTLQESMFPLEFYIEDTNRSLNPTGKNGAGEDIVVPVKIGPSIYDDTNANSYYFIRTVNWDEYEPMRDAWVAANKAGQSVEGIIDFTTEFKTVKSTSATTVYVDNEYFNMDSVDFENERFSLTALTSTVNYKAQSVEVLLTADSDISWTASVSGGATLADGSESGIGSKTLTVTMPENTTNQRRTFTLTASGESGSEASVEIIQKGSRDNQPAAFGYNMFSINGGTSSLDSNDGYLTVSLRNFRNSSSGGNYITTGIYGSSTPGSITFTPKYGVAIKRIVITYANNYVDDNPTFSPDSSDSDTVSGRTVTWTGNSTAPVTMTSSRNDRRITNIQVTYE